MLISMPTEVCIWLSETDGSWVFCWSWGSPPTPCVCVDGWLKNAYWANCCSSVMASIATAYSTQIRLRSSISIWAIRLASDVPSVRPAQHLKEWEQCYLCEREWRREGGRQLLKTRVLLGVCVEDQGNYILMAPLSANCRCGLGWGHTWWEWWQTLII